ncbi:MAG TPA: phosphatidylserine/phosphatidylglycerophosphate/cardiolipin synthase family protein [Sphingomicrobium sp.]|nr:phosphatidylserine/phosphatidylglycerophosphate/cardiolipin synthase family protein [Sphingomicrobium sp.]
MVPALVNPPTRLASRAARGHITTMDAAPNSVTVDGNSLTLITAGPDRLAALLELIDGAKRSLRLLYYIYRGDRSGGLVRDALNRALDRGVTVALLVDGFGFAAPDKYFHALVAKGMRFCRFHPTLGRRYLIRNHQKLALADEERVLIGGFNIEDSYFGTAADGAWRDLGLMLEGPAAARLAPYFDELLDWAMTKGGRIRALNRIITAYSETQGILQWTYGGPTRGLSPWASATCRDLLVSKDVEMIAAYFSPTGAMLRRIARAGRKGRAQLITAARSDNHATVAAARHTYRRLLGEGVEIYEFAPAKLHTKLVVLDDVVHIGSSNFDIRSLYLNLEMMLRVDDPAFAKMMRHYFATERAASVQITRDLHKRRSSWFNQLRWALSFYLVTSADYTVTRRLNLGIG